MHTSLCGAAANLSIVESFAVIRLCSLIVPLTMSHWRGPVCVYVLFALVRGWCMHNAHILVSSCRRCIPRLFSTICLLNWAAIHAIPCSFNAHSQYVDCVNYVIVSFCIIWEKRRSVDVDKTACYWLHEASMRHKKNNNVQKKARSGLREMLPRNICRQDASDKFMLLCGSEVYVKTIWVSCAGVSINNNNQSVVICRDR